MIGTSIHRYEYRTRRATANLHSEAHLRKPDAPVEGLQTRGHCVERLPSGAFAMFSTRRDSRRRPLMRSAGWPRVPINVGAIPARINPRPAASGIGRVRVQAEEIPVVARGHPPPAPRPSSRDPGTHSGTVLTAPRVHRAAIPSPARCRRRFAPAACLLLGMRDLRRQPALGDHLRQRIHTRQGGRRPRTAASPIADDHDCPDVASSPVRSDTAGGTESAGEERQLARHRHCRPVPGPTKRSEAEKRPASSPGGAVRVFTAGSPQMARTPVACGPWGLADLEPTFWFSSRVRKP